METKRLPIELTGQEVYYLEANLDDEEDVHIHPGEEMFSEFPVRELILLIGGAFNELVSPGKLSEGPVIITIDEDMAWYLRNITESKALATDGQTNVGIGLLNKIYSLLLEFAIEWSDVEEIFDAN